MRVVNRSGRARVPAGVQVVGGDAGDPGFAAAAAQGARVVYQVLGPAYHRWAEEFPGLQAGVLAAAQATGARLVVLENVYAYGAPVDGRPLTGDSPFRAHTRKGRIRARMTAALIDGAAGRVELAIGRASNYFGPRGGVQAINLGDQAMLAALTGGKAQVLGHPDQPHTYTYLPRRREAAGARDGRDALRVRPALRRRLPPHRGRARRPGHPGRTGPRRHPGHLPLTAPARRPP